MALVYGRDAFTLLEAVHAPDAPAWLRELPAVQVLRTMRVQNYHRTATEAGAEVKRRESKDLPPGQNEAGLSVRHRRPLRTSCDDADDQDSATGQAPVSGLTDVDLVAGPPGEVRRRRCSSKS